MCISVEPGEFNNTYIADFPATPTSDTDRVLVYLNEVETSGERIPAYLARALGRTAAAETLPNAMLFPVYGDNVRVLPCNDPKASREWLMGQHGSFLETWEAEPEYSITTRSAIPFEDDEPEIVRSGSYNVAVAAGVADIPRVLTALKTVSPGKVPEVSPEILEQMDRYYRMQGLGMPHFVVAAFALERGTADDMNPIAVRYEQMPSVHGKVALPALDYHGEGEWQAHVKRDHHLLIATNRLTQLLSPIASGPDSSATLPEFAGAPTEFPIMLVDRRDSRRDSDQATWAPNTDYLIDTAAIEAALTPAEAELIPLKDATMDPYDRRHKVSEIVRKQLGDGLILARSNQAATTAAEYHEVMARDRNPFGSLGFDY